MQDYKTRVKGEQKRELENIETFLPTYKTYKYTEKINWGR